MNPEGFVFLLPGACRNAKNHQLRGTANLNVFVSSRSCTYLSIKCDLLTLLTVPDRRNSRFNPDTSSDGGWHPSLSYIALFHLLEWFLYLRLMRFASEHLYKLESLLSKVDLISHLCFPFSTPFHTAGMTQAIIFKIKVLHKSFFPLISYAQTRTVACLDSTNGVCPVLLIRVLI